MPDSVEWVTPKEAAALLHVGESTIRRWVRSGLISALPPHTRIRIPVSEVQRLVTATRRPVPEAVAS